MKWRCYLQLAYCSRNKLGVFLRSSSSSESREFMTIATFLRAVLTLRQMSVTARRHGAAALQGWRLRGLPGPRGIHQRAAGGIRGLSNQNRRLRVFDISRSTSSAKKNGRFGAAAPTTTHQRRRRAAITRGIIIRIHTHLRIYSAAILRGSAAGLQHLDDLLRRRRRRYGTHCKFSIGTRPLQLNLRAARGVAGSNSSEPHLSVYSLPSARAAFGKSAALFLDQDVSIASAGQSFDEAKKSSNPASALPRELLISKNNYIRTLTRTSCSAKNTRLSFPIFLILHELLGSLALSTEWVCLTLKFILLYLNYYAKRFLPIEAIKSTYTRAYIRRAACYIASSLKKGGGDQLGAHIRSIIEQENMYSVDKNVDAVIDLQPRVYHQKRLLFQYENSCARLATMQTP
ncbi:unnamed protein product, partial [Trichogramma brassicae]